MGFTPDHSGNLPHEFERCQKCGSKGVYHLRPTVTSKGEMIPESWRCKYCGTMFYRRDAEGVFWTRTWTG
jgi:NAD-dependent SIR2 family protein deacetylase